MKLLLSLQRNGALWWKNSIAFETLIINLTSSIGNALFMALFLEQRCLNKKVMCCWPEVSVLMQNLHIVLQLQFP